MQVKFALRAVAWLAAGIVTATTLGCSTNLEGPGIDYRSDVSAKKSSLEVPPDLTQVPREERFSVPDAAGRTSASASQVRGVASTSGPASVASATAPMATNTNAVARVERDGTQRWLVVQLPPERVWQVVREFWVQNGFTYRVENREIGVLETNWAEDRAKLPKDFVRRTLGAIAGSLYDTGERDLFRTRVERSGDATEVYVTHRGATEVLNATKDGTLWQPRANDPNLEAEFLQKLLVRFGAADAEAKAMLIAKAPPPEAAAASTAAPANARAKLLDENPAVVVVTDPIDRAWRRVGLALDRTGFTVEERDRANGTYGVRYVEVEKPDEGGLFGSFFSKKPDAKAQQFRITVRADGPSASRVSLADKDDKAVTPEVTRRILGLIANDLK